MHHKHPGDTCLDPKSLELILLPLRQQVVDGVPQLIMIYAAVGGDCLPCSVSYCILVSGPEGWFLMTVEHIRSDDDLHDCHVLFSSRAWNSLDSELCQSCDVDVVQRIPQYASGDWGFIYKSLDLIGVVKHLILLSVAQRSVVFIIFTFSLVSLFFFLLILFLLVVIVVVIILWQLLSFLRVFSYRYCDHNLEGVLPLRNILRGVGLRLWRGWHIPQR
jgi:hypothetical protein